MKHQPSGGHAVRRAAPKTEVREPASGDGAAAAEPAASQDDRDEVIRLAAYYLYQTRGCEGGHDLEDWLQAEALVEGRTPTPAESPTTTTH